MMHCSDSEEIFKMFLAATEAYTKLFVFTFPLNWLKKDSAKHFEGKKWGPPNLALKKGC